MRRLKTLMPVLLAFGLRTPLPSAEPLSAVTSVDQNLGITTIPLWPAGTAPADNRSGSTLTVFVPHSKYENGTAVIIAPGGAYLGLASNLEGRQVADWFTARGVTAFVLKYRLGAGNIYPAPLEDAQQAVRLVRSVASTYHVASDRIGIMGFSAGGHLAAMEATSADDGQPNANDPVGRLSDRPNFLVLGYAWLNAMQPNEQKLITYCSVLHIEANQCKGFEEKYTPALHVTKETPSTFIYSTTDDETVPVQGSVAFYSALISAGVPAEMHLFRHGRHGSGLGRGDLALDEWPALLEAWMRGQGLLNTEPATSK
jgi:acetyl esterase/lipase